MKKIVVKRDPIYSLDDCRKIQNALANKGYEATIEQACELWKWYSDDWCATWLIVTNDDEEIFESVRPYFDEV